MDPLDPRGEMYWLKMDRRAKCVGFGVSVGVQIGHISPPIIPIPVRARAYNDCAQDAILLKPYSRRGIQGPKMVPFWVLEMHIR